jgi:diguanylate cyclase (GGDEF)-like protein
MTHGGSTSEVSPLGNRSSSLRSRALALMFVIGSLLALVALAVPHPDGVQEVRWAVNSALALPVGALLWRYGHRLPEPAIHATLVAGSVIVGLGITFGNGGVYSVAACFFVVWVALYTFLFFRLALAVAHLVLNTVVLVVGLVVAGVDGVAGVALMVTGTSVVAGSVVGRARLELDRLARTDPLTGLHNRRSLEEVLRAEQARCARSGRPYSVVLVDLDDFKAVNDTQGHHAGDELLIASARAWQACLRPMDVLARFGGDEFVAVLPDCGPAEAASVGRRMQESAPSPCSCGVATSCTDEEPGVVLQRADEDLYATKRRHGDPPA